MMVYIVERGTDMAACRGGKSEEVVPEKTFHLKQSSQF